jgi:hypothetical protein
MWRERNVVLHASFVDVIIVEKDDLLDKLLR